MVAIKLNGTRRSIDADPQTPLLWAIRDIVGLTGTKFGCELLGEPRKLDFAAMQVDYPNYGASLDMYPVDTARLRGVLDLVARNSDWGKPLPPRQGRGVAVHRSFLTYVAAVAHVAVGDDGQVTIPRVDVALDCGLVVNPDPVRAQFEGAAIMGHQQRTLQRDKHQAGPDRAEQFRQLPCGPHRHHTANPRPHRRQRCAAGRRRRAWRAADRSRDLQCDLRGDW
jgi:hypothetical protein